MIKAPISVEDGLRDRPESERRDLESEIAAIVKSELDEFIDPPETSGLTVFQDERRSIARAVAGRVLRLLQNKDSGICLPVEPS